MPAQIAPGTSTSTQTAPREAKVRLIAIDTEEVSLVDEAANGRIWLSVKNRTGKPMKDDGKGGSTTTGGSTDNTQSGASGTSGASTETKDNSATTVIAKAASGVSKTVAEGADGVTVEQVITAVKSLFAGEEALKSAIEQVAKASAKKMGVKRMKALCDAMAAHKAAGDMFSQLLSDLANAEAAEEDAEGEVPAAKNAGGVSALTDAFEARLKEIEATVAKSTNAAHAAEARATASENRIKELEAELVTSKAAIAKAEETAATAQQEARKAMSVPARAGASGAIPTTGDVPTSKGAQPAGNDMDLTPRRDLRRR